MTLVVVGGTKLIGRKWCIAVTGIVAEARRRDTSVAITHGPRQRVIGDQREVTAHSLAETEVHPVVALAIDGLINAYAVEDRLSCSSECVGEWTGQDYISP